MSTTDMMPDRFVITCFWPPNPKVLDIEEQFRLMHEAGINEVFGAGNGCDKSEIQDIFLRLCEKWGMTLIVSDGTFGETVHRLTEDEIAANAAKYKDNPTVTGFHLRDEPEYAKAYFHAYNAIRRAAPYLDGHINFLHMTAIGDVMGYHRKMGDWMSLTNAVSPYPTYLMFDYYPFRHGSAFDYDRYFMQLQTVREIGLRNGNPTALYLQTNGTPNTVPGQMRMPTADELRYEVYSSLAYGFKKLSYFLWTYDSCTEEKPTAIVTKAGNPTAYYIYASELNHEAAALGEILVKCDAVDVYMTKIRYKSTELLPRDYILSLTDNSNADMIVSRFVHRESGRNYLMLVNNDMCAPQTAAFMLADDISGLEIVSKHDGTCTEYVCENSIYTVTLSAGDGILFALPEDYICPIDLKKANKPIKGVNIAPDAKVTATSSFCSDGWYVYNLTDRIVHYNEHCGDTNGWQSENDAAPILTFDCREPLTFEKIRLYPAAVPRDDYTKYMPVDGMVSVSDDGIHWTQAAAFSDYRNAVIPRWKAFDLALDGARGRYLRLEITRANLDENGKPVVQLGEVEIYAEPHTDKTELNALLEQYRANGYDTDTACYRTAVEAQMRSDVRQPYVDLLAHSLRGMLRVINNETCIDFSDRPE